MFSSYLPQSLTVLHFTTEKKIISAIIHKVDLVIDWMTLGNETVFSKQRR